MTTITNVFLSIGFERITNQFVVLFHADDFLSPYVIHAADTLADAVWYCGAAFPFLTVSVEQVEVSA